MFFLLFFTCVSGFILLFSFKLISLLILEFLGVVTLMIFVTLNHSNFYNVFISLLLSLFMVLESVLGISVLVSTSRISTFFDSHFNLF